MDARRKRSSPRSKPALANKTMQRSEIIDWAAMKMMAVEMTLIGMSLISDTEWDRLTPEERKRRSDAFERAADMITRMKLRKAEAEHGV